MKARSLKFGQHNSDPLVDLIQEVKSAESAGATNRPDAVAPPLAAAAGAVRAPSDQNNNHNTPGLALQSNDQILSDVLQRARQEEACNLQLQQVMKAVSLKFGQENSDSLAATPVTDDEAAGSASPAETPVSTMPPLPDGRSAGVEAPEVTAPTRRSEPESLGPSSELRQTGWKEPRPTGNGGSLPLVSKGGTKILSELLRLARQEGFSDLQLQPGRPVYANNGGATRPYGQWGKLSPDALSEMLELMYSRRTIYQGFEAEQSEGNDVWHRLITDRKVDFACEGKDPTDPLGAGRLRVQGHFSHQGLGMTIRVLRDRIAVLEQLGLPADVVASLVQKVTKQQGLGLVVGPTGSGKTTTLAAIIDWVRRKHNKHIVTIEDPIEYCYPDTIEVPGGMEPSPAVVTQQEVGHHVHDFDQGLSDALRKKPNIILVGEIRTAETLRIALEAAETGHFVLSTLHTRGAGKTLGRIRQMFNLEQARSILQQFADAGSFILSQGLMPDTSGRYLLCCEYFSIQEIEDRNAIRKYAEGGFQDVEERLNKPYNRKWNTELKALLNAKRITPEVYAQFYQVTGLENK
jgi:twitching motility protein PilT